MKIINIRCENHLLPRYHEGQTRQYDYLTIYGLFILWMGSSVYNRMDSLLREFGMKQPARMIHYSNRICQDASL